MDVRFSGFAFAPSTYTFRVAFVPPPPGASGMEKRVTRVLVATGVVNSTYWPVCLSVTALRPDASPAKSPILRLGPTTWAPPPTAPDSASTVVYGMVAPRAALARSGVGRGFPAGGVNAAREEPLPAATVRVTVRLSGDWLPAASRARTL